MPPTTTTEQLADYEQRYRELAAQLATIGLIHSGSVTRRYTRCATPAANATPSHPNPTAPTTNGPPRTTAILSPRRSPRTKRSSTKNGSPTTDDYDTSSNRCARSRPKPPS